MYEQEAQLIVPALERATHAVALWVERALGDLDISQAEAHILAALARTPQLTINDLHRGFGHKRSTLTGLLDRLESRGLVQRARHQTSRRLVAVRLTEAGRELATRVDAALRGLEVRIAARAGTGDVDGFLRVLAALEATIQEDLS